MKTRYIIALAAGALALASCQREELAEPGVLSGKEGVVKFAPSVGRILSGVKSSASEDASAATYTQLLTLTSEDGRYTLPMTLSITSLEIGDGTKATLINDPGSATGTVKPLGDFADKIDNTFWVAAWNDATTPAQIIPDATAKAFTGGYVSTNKEYQKVMCRDGVSGTHYWMTVQPQTATVEGAPEHGDDEYIWKSTEAKKTFYAYANVPSDATVALLASAGGQTMTCTGIPAQDVLMGYYTGNGSTGSPATQTGTADIQFHHPFAAVKVKKGTVADGVTITDVAIENVYGKGGEGDDGKLMVKQVTDVFTWTRADGEGFKDENLVESISVTCDGEAALVLPQTFPSKARIRVTLQQDGKTFNVYYLLSGTLVAGTVYTYTIGYDPLPEDLLPGKFSVSATDYVQFSRGNLFCTRSGEEGSYMYEFGLERNQYDFRTRPGYPSVINGVYAEEGTGANMSGHFYWDIAKAQAGKDYGAFSTTSPSGGTTSDILDWGPALDAASHWTTLSRDEWTYLISTRKVKSATGLHNTCEFVYFKGVDGLDKGVNGLIIYPDDYDGEMFTNQQEITAIPDGCVFIPMAGKFLGGEITNVNERCNYWTSTHGDAGENAYQFLAYGTVCHANNLLSRANGMSVRLVQRFDKPVEYVEIAGLKWATENLAITESGKKEWKGTGHIVGDYFQWGAYAGYCGDVTDADKGLVLYQSFTCKGCGDEADKFTMKTGKRFNAAFAPFNKGTSPYPYLEYTAAPATLASEHDVANIVLGGKWRMPTTGEIVAMREATYWVWDENDKGYYVCLPSGTCEAGGRGNAFPSGTDKTDAMLFIPASGYVKYGTDSGNKLFQSTIVSDIWSSSLNEQTNNAYNLYFGGTGADPVGILPGYNNSRYMGFSIRPVANK